MSVTKAEAAFFLGLALMSTPMFAVWFAPALSLVILIYFGFALSVVGLLALCLASK
jgi:hypothetical protein